MEIKLQDKVYLQADDLVRLYPERFKEGKKKPRQILQFKRIPQDHYMFGSCLKTGWRPSIEKNNKAKLLITKEWLDQYLATTNSESNRSLSQVPVDTQSATPAPVEIRDAPPVLELTEAEKFKDANGKALEIEVRGARDEDGCFFRVKDVAVSFNDISCQDTLLDDRCGYTPRDDFLYFYRPGDSRDNKVQQKKKELFLTYQGILRYLFVSRNPNARTFRKWATRVLFAIQMGSTEQRESVAAELLGVSVETVGKFMSACVRDIPMVYMLHLGRVPESIEVEGDRNDFLFFKIGQHGKEDTKYGFRGRSKGHMQEFKEFRDEMSYLHFVFLDPMYVSEAESRIKEFFSEYRACYQNKSEVYMIPKSKLGEIKKFFEHLSVLFSGNHADIQRSWDRFKNDTRVRIHDLEVENRHLKEMLENTRIQLQARVSELKERIAEQVATIRAFLSRMTTN